MSPVQRGCGPTLILMVALSFAPAWSDSQAGTRARGADPSDRNGPGPAAFPGGLLDPNGDSAYLRHRPGGLIALDLITGAPRWEIAGAFLPLAVRGPRLIVISRRPGDEPHVALLDAGGKGAVLSRSDPLPAGAWPAEDGPVFVEALPRGSWESGRLFLQWDCRTVLALAATRSPTIYSGDAQVDLETGTVRVLQETVVRGAWPRPVPFPALDRPVLAHAGLVFRLEGEGLRVTERGTGEFAWSHPVYRRAARIQAGP